ncbi:hypothetical protein AAW12_15190 [Sphingobacterium sp. Ag1]|uniref:hypothetical protein n=1 Tax=Sphingobacterium sp. Ag1 TaxID=1643451 RepID=UPI000627AA7B|nr:hypothetical protein [Sphingobacterium sp. Ag1]KKO90444.1 hypothetical protein AAW12_15190 [Sphingobacterium sp. Ag1]
MQYKPSAINQCFWSTILIVNPYLFDDMGFVTNPRVIASERAIRRWIFLVDLHAKKQISNEFMQL